MALGHVIESLFLTFPAVFSRQERDDDEYIVYITVSYQIPLLIQIKVNDNIFVLKMYYYSYDCSIQVCSVLQQNASCTKILFIDNA